MTTKLSERLRDLRNGLFPDIETVNAVLDQCIAQAEAQEAQAVELSDEFVKARAMEIYPPDEVNDGHPWYGHRRAIEDTAARQMVRHLHKCGYLRPSQAIGEQTPADERPWIGERVQHRTASDHFVDGCVVENEWQMVPDDKAVRVAWANGQITNHPAPYRDLVRPLYRSPMSSEARDKAIEALERCLGQLKIMQGDSSISQMDVMHVLARGSALEALSALRGE